MQVHHPVRDSGRGEKRRRCHGGSPAEDCPLRQAPLHHRLRAASRLSTPATANNRRSHRGRATPTGSPSRCSTPPDAWEGRALAAGGAGHPQSLDRLLGQRYLGLRLTNQLGPCAGRPGFVAYARCQRGHAPGPGRCLPGGPPHAPPCSQAGTARAALPLCAARAGQPSTLPPYRHRQPAGGGQVNPAAGLRVPVGMRGSRDQR
jgi:hypothetical protein